MSQLGALQAELESQRQQSLLRQQLLQDQLDRSNALRQEIQDKNSAAKQQMEQRLDAARANLAAADERLAVEEAARAQHQRERLESDRALHVSLETLQASVGEVLCRARTRSWLGASSGKHGHFSDSMLTFALLRVLTDRKAGTQSGGFGGTTRDKWEGEWRCASGRVSRCTGGAARPLSATPVRGHFGGGWPSDTGKRAAAGAGWVDRVCRV